MSWGACIGPAGGTGRTGVIGTAPAMQAVQQAAADLENASATAGGQDAAAQAVPTDSDDHHHDR